MASAWVRFGKSRELLNKSEKVTEDFLNNKFEAAGVFEEHRNDNKSVVEINTVKYRFTYVVTR